MGPAAQALVGGVVALLDMRFDRGQDKSLEVMRVRFESFAILPGTVIQALYGERRLNFYK